MNHFCSFVRGTFVLLAGRLERASDKHGLGGDVLVHVVFLEIFADTMLILPVLVGLVAVESLHRLISAHVLRREVAAQILRRDVDAREDCQLGRQVLAWRDVAEVRLPLLL